MIPESSFPSEFDSALARHEPRSVEGCHLIVDTPGGFLATVGPFHLQSEQLGHSPQRLREINDWGAFSIMENPCFPQVAPTTKIFRYRQTRVRFRLPIKN